MKRSHDIAIRLTNISKCYTIHHEKPTLIERLTKRKDEEFWALKDINLTIRKGERVGIIGPNGSGKTTLLKVIAGISTPTSGAVETKGKIVSLIDLEAGFHPDLTGIQNVYLHGMLLGMSRKELGKKLRGVIAFADIGKFIDAPLFTYSAGMKLRLGFSVAVHANPDILILDEAIGAGDNTFRNKTHAKTQAFFKQGKTILVATHWLEYIKRSCNRVLVLRRGSITNEGPLHVVLEQYQ